ncbi:Crp/Fnr family transcriptional regulator [Campylobacter geochelonis]|uniref:Crp/Fnr family transcriptional regulator n=1 Tax=Campylobacter geochelonis TaxID=1780362 RepID=UPI000770954E|nr:Crp/Fnr family transcriptional regulator [Campylobacter geochelonis]CZE49406.1 transcriptional regulator [Campylobacter geochelonis]
MIKQIPFFSSLDDESCEKLNDISIFKKYKKGEVLFLEGEESKWLNILLKGTIGIYKSSPKGKNVFMHEIRPINFIAELANFEDIPYPASSYFTSNSEILRIDYVKFKELFLSRPEISLEFLKSLAKKLKVMNDVFVREIVLDADGKIAKFVYENLELFKTLKQSQVAAILNVAPETLSRTLAKFRQDNLFKYDKNGEIIGVDERLKEFFVI